MPAGRAARVVPAGMDRRLRNRLCTGRVGLRVRLIRWVDRRGPAFPLLDLPVVEQMRGVVRIGTAGSGAGVRAILGRGLDELVDGFGRVGAQQERGVGLQFAERRGGSVGPEDEGDLVDAGHHHDDLGGREQHGQRLQALVVGAGDGDPLGGLPLPAALLGQHRVGGLDPGIDELLEPRPGLVAEVFGGALVHPARRLGRQLRVPAATGDVAGLPGLHHPRGECGVPTGCVAVGGLQDPGPQQRVPVGQVQDVGELPARDRLGQPEQQRQLVDRELRDLRGAVAAVGPRLLGARQQPAGGVAALLEAVAVVEHRPLRDQHQPAGAAGPLAGDLGDQRVGTPLPAHRLDPLRLHDHEPRREHRRFSLAGKANLPDRGTSGRRLPGDPAPGLGVLPREVGDARRAG